MNFSSFHRVLRAPQMIRPSGEVRTFRATRTWSNPGI